MLVFIDEQRAMLWLCALFRVSLAETDNTTGLDLYRAFLPGAQSALGRSAPHPL
jgi:hypothetical protein